MSCSDRTCGAPDCGRCYPWMGPCEHCGGYSCACEDYQCPFCDGFWEDEDFTPGGEEMKECACHRCSDCNLPTEHQPDPRGCQCARCEDCGGRVATACACVNKEG